jgi:HD superfamily phosphohydrolase
MLEARYYFSERVYYHHAKVAAGALIARAVELALEADVLREVDLYDTTDASLLDTLERAAERAGPGTAQRVKSLTQRYRDRRLPKRACVFPRSENAGVQEELVERFFARDRQPERTASALQLRPGATSR